LKKLSTACDKIRNVKTYMSDSAFKIIYHACFHSVMSYGIIFRRNLSHSSTILSIKKRKLELWKYVGIGFQVET